MSRLKLKKEVRKFLLNNLALTDEDSQVLHQAAKYNTYVETISNKADMLHLKVKEEYVQSISKSYSIYVKNLIKKQRFGVVDLICDITTENFYGEAADFYIHPWTGEKGVKGKYHYFVVSILVRNKIIPFYAILLELGGSKAELIGKAISYCQSLGLRIGKILLDRGFYSGEIINKLKMEKVKYLIFVPKKSLFKCMLEGTEESVVIEHEIVYNKDFSKLKTQTDIALVKDVLDYDWVFATDINLRNIKKYVSVYKKRWAIETMFRVHDEARIKTKSKVSVVRLFYFVVSLLFVLLWNLYEKQRITFKLFIIQLFEDVRKEIARVGS